MTPEDKLREAIVEAIEGLAEALGGVESPETEDEEEPEDGMQTEDEAGETETEDEVSAPAPALVAALRRS